MAVFGIGTQIAPKRQHQTQIKISGRKSLTKMYQEILK